MLTLLAFLAVFAGVLMLRTPLLRAPVAFYVIALAYDVVVLACPQVLHELPGVSAASTAIERGMVPFALFLVVMYIGVLPESSAPRRYLQPIRGYLSIFAALLACGHFARYLASLVLGLSTQASFATMRADVFLAIALCLAVLLAVLATTSVGRVRELMGSSRWRAVQRWAYVFVGIMYVHALVMLGPMALRGGDAAIRLACYTVALAVYVVLKVRLVLASRRLDRPQ